MLQHDREHFLLSCEALQSCHYKYPLVNVYKHLWKITIWVNQLNFYGPYFPVRKMLNYQRVLDVELTVPRMIDVVLGHHPSPPHQNLSHRNKVGQLTPCLGMWIPTSIFTCIPPLYSNNDNNNNNNNNIILYIINYIYDMIHISYIIIYIYTYEASHPFCICYLTLWSTGAASPTAAVLARRSSWWPRWHLLLRGPMGFGTENLGIPIVNNIIVMVIPKYYYI